MAEEGAHPIEELLPAYALNALEPAEREQVDAHLAECEQCSALLAEHLDVTVAMAQAHEPVAPSAALRARVLGLSESPGAASRQESPGRWRPTWTGRAPRLMWGAAAALVLSVAGLTAVVVAQQQRIERVDDQADQVQVQLQEQRDAAYWAALPGVSTVAMQGTGDPPRPRALLMVNADHTAALLITLDLPPLPRRKAYQLWLVERDGTFVGAALFSVDMTGYAHVLVRMTEEMSEYEAVSISLEPEVGSPAPSGTEILGVTLSSP